MFETAAQPFPESEQRAFPMISRQMAIMLGALSLRSLRPLRELPFSGVSLSVAAQRARYEPVSAL
ncbi:MAG: hypothetical protein B7Y36_04405 [Novosphingobium sp. 28-62-57]|nr:MAG: hypothetical protein B7Z34_04070 [Novosphingobium sp. 12-62-10]OYZ11416.1 MAG: hypothetical protein B7Y36_04405 [Novosphingobium sp. 28-62-57]